jgi:hypothetical protein
MFRHLVDHHQVNYLCLSAELVSLILDPYWYPVRKLDGVITQKAKIIKLYVS